MSKHLGQLLKMTTCQKNGAITPFLRFLYTTKDLKNIHLLLFFDPLLKQNGFKDVAQYKIFITI